MQSSEVLLPIYLSEEIMFLTPVISEVMNFKVTSRHDFFVSQGRLLKWGLGHIWREGSIGKEFPLFGLELLSQGLVLFHLTSQFQAVV